MKDGTWHLAEEVDHQHVSLAPCPFLLVPSASFSLFLVHQEAGGVQPLPHTLRLFPWPGHPVKCLRLRDLGRNALKPWPKPIISHSGCLCLAFHHCKAKITNGHAGLMNPVQNAATIGRHRKLHYNSKIASSWLPAAQFLLEFTHLVLPDSHNITPPSMSLYLIVCVKLF